MEVQVCPLPEDPKRSVVVVRVSPTRLVHSTDRRTRIYIRVADNNRGYELATLDNLRWLWQQREESVSQRGILVANADMHANSSAIPWQDVNAEERWMVNPLLATSIVPSFPGLTPTTNPQQLLKVSEEIGTVRLQDWPSMVMELPWRPNHWRTLPGGVTNRTKGGHPRACHLELGESGLLYCAVSHPTNENANELDEQTGGPSLPAFAVLGDLALSLRFAEKFYEKLSWRLPVKVKAELRKIQKTTLDYRSAQRGNYLQMVWISDECPDPTIVLLDKELGAQEIASQHGALLAEAATSLTRAYGLGWDAEHIAQMIARWKG